MTPDEIETLFSNVPDSEESRVEALQQVLDVVQKLHETKSQDLVTLAEKVGNGSRQEPWRVPLGESGLLGFFLDLLKGDDTPQDLAIQCFRIIGNSCADNDENRQRVIDSGCIPQLVKLLETDSLLQYAIPVLFNICVDYEPAQAAAYKARLAIHLLDSQLLEKTAAYKHIVYKLIGFVATQEFEADLVVTQTPYRLLNLAIQEASSSESPDLDNFLGLSSAALAYLSHQYLQDSFLETPDGTQLFLEAFKTSTNGGELFQLETPEEQSQLRQLQGTFTQALADLSANPLFVSLFPLDSPVVNSLIDWISSPHDVILQSAACLTLGNLARSDASSTTLVQEMLVHKPLIATLSSHSLAQDPQLLHCILSFLKNLSIAASNKAVLGDAGLLDPEVLPRIWHLDTQPQVQFDAISLTRLLLVNCPANVRRVCVPAAGQDQTSIQQLMELHPKADQDPIKMEISRAVANICRVLHSSNPIGSALLPQPPLPDQTEEEEEAQHLLQEFYAKHTTIPTTLLYLGLQSRFPVLRSELWFVLALMARSPQGAVFINDAMLHQHPQIIDILVESVTGEKPSAPAIDNDDHHDASDDTPPTQGSDNPDDDDDDDDVSAITKQLSQLEPQQADPAKAATMVKVDRENGLVLIAELLKQCSSDLPAATKATFERILRTGGELVLGSRE
ncbi:ARM repeat-containing protein [Hypoxylon fragiforme]|uniref:ARM repeat-containing protein n=1 Tax=Hypoxylon fragiforme TaxID=63214 RepID=UPI0020C74489|nr:ARM repeat-containing protein [Hypoxylon fragiforme]KAI2607705.1 ARM repeat-containing protein [Hypoxylon fragiforme]